MDFLIFTGVALLSMAGVVIILEWRHGVTRQRFLDEMTALRIHAETERRELYARIQRYTFPDNQTGKSRSDGDVKEEDDPYPEIYQMMSGAWFDPTTQTTHWSKGEAAAWRKHIQQKGYGADYKPDDALINF